LTFALKSWLTAFLDSRFGLKNFDMDLPLVLRDGKLQLWQWWQLRRQAQLQDQQQCMATHNAYAADQPFWDLPGSVAEVRNAHQAMTSDFYT